MRERERESKTIKDQANTVEGQWEREREQENERSS